MFISTVIVKPLQRLTPNNTQDMLINYRIFIEPNVNFAKQARSPSPSVTGAQYDLVMALIFTVYILTHVHKLLHYSTVN